MAGRLLGRFNPALDSNGDPLPGAKLYSFRSGTGTNQALYTTSALTVAHTNPVVANSAGRLPEMWADVGSLFRVRVDDADGATIYGPEDGLAPLGAGTAVAPASYTADTTLTLADLGRRISATGANSWTLTLPVGAGLPIGWSFTFVNAGSGTITIVPSGADTIDTGLSRTGHAGEIINVTLTGTTTFVTDNVSSAVGRHALWVPVDAMIGRITNGPGASVTETSSNKVMLRTFDFDAATPQYVQFRLAMPKGWNEGTIPWRPVWLHDATTTNFKVSWGLQAVALSDDDATDAAFGTAQYANETGGTTGDLYDATEGAAITVAGSPVAEDVVIFQVLRKADDVVNDTLAIVARLLGIVLYLTTDTGNDA